MAYEDHTLDCLPTVTVGNDFCVKTLHVKILVDGRIYESIIVGIYLNTQIIIRIYSNSYVFEKILERERKNSLITLLQLRFPSYYCSISSKSWDTKNCFQFYLGGSEGMCGIMMKQWLSIHGPNGICGTWTSPKSRCPEYYSFTRLYYVPLFRQTVIAS